MKATKRCAQALRDVLRRWLKLASTLLDDDAVMAAVDADAAPHAIGEPAVRRDVLQRGVVEFVRRNGGADQPSGPRRASPVSSSMTRPWPCGRSCITVSAGIAPTIACVTPRHVMERVRYISPPHSA